MIQRLKRKPLVVAKALALVRDAKKNTHKANKNRTEPILPINPIIYKIYIFAKHDEKVIEATLKAVEETRKRKKERAKQRIKAKRDKRKH